jgi:hypothetical protein
MQHQVKRGLRYAPCQRAASRVMCAASPTKTVSETSWTASCSSTSTPLPIPQVCQSTQTAWSVLHASAGFGPGMLDPDTQWVARVSFCHCALVCVKWSILGTVFAHRSCAGELRGHVVRSVPQLWDLESRGMVLFADLAGGSSFPSTPSTAAGSGQVLLSRDGTMAMAFMGVTGARKAVSCLPGVMPCPCDQCGDSAIWQCCAQ